MRYFLGIYDSAGYLYKLSKGLEANGHKVRYVNISRDRFKYSITKNYHLSRVIEEFAIKYKSASLKRVILYPAILISRLITFANELFRSDIFIFSGTQSFLNFYDLPILNFFGKKTIIIYLGSDARPPYLSGKYLDDHNNTFTSNIIHVESKKIKSRINRVEKWASFIINHTGTAQLFKRKCAMLSYFGIPYDEDLLKKSNNKKQYSNNKLRILHAPSRPKAKGTETFENIISKLKEAGHEIDFIKITNKSNEEVISEICRCDLILDELYSDMPLATFGVEASIFKKPVLVGGYFSRYILKSTPKNIIPPVIFVEPELIEQALNDLVNNRQNLQYIGEMQYSYVKSNYAPIEVARKIDLLIANKVPSEYWFFPTEENYTHGWGISEKHLKEQLQIYINELGRESLLLEHNLKLKNTLLELYTN